MSGVWHHEPAADLSSSHADIASPPWRNGSSPAWCSASSPGSSSTGQLSARRCDAGGLGRLPAPAARRVPAADQDDHRPARLRDDRHRHRRDGRGHRARADRRQGAGLVHLGKPGVAGAGHAAGQPAPARPHADAQGRGAGRRARRQADLSLRHFVLEIFPTSAFDAMATNNILQILVFSVFVGIALIAIGEKTARPIVRACGCAGDADAQDHRLRDALCTVRGVRRAGGGGRRAGPWRDPQLRRAGQPSSTAGCCCCGWCCCRPARCSSAGASSR